MSAKAPPEPPQARPEASVTQPVSDVRSSRIYLFSRGAVQALLRRTLSVTALVVLDVVGLALGLYLALVLRGVFYDEVIFWNLLWSQEWDWLKFLAPITVLVFWQAGLYAPREGRAGAGRLLAAIVTVALIVLVFGLGTGYEFNTYGLIPTAVIACALVMGGLRAAYGSVSLEAMKATGIRRRVVLVGEGESLRRLTRQLALVQGGIEYELVGVVSREDVPGVARLGTSVDDIAVVVEEVRPDELLLAEAAYSERTVLDVVQQAHRLGVKVRLAPNTTELLRHEGEYVPGQGIPLFELRPPILTGFDWALKRSFDIVVSAALVVVGLPLWLLIALAIKLDSRGPVFYVDRRIGVGEGEFGMLKFRTMVAQAAELQPDVEELNEASGALFKIRDDPRVTRVGRVLRRLSIDELPQLANVLRGQMSLVGPRPLPLRDHELLEDWHKARCLVLPGMTGLWQISGRSGLSFDDLVRLDFTYLENWSVWVDVSIIVKTIPAVLSGRGAY